MGKSMRNRKKEPLSSTITTQKQSGISQWWSELPTSSKWGIGILTGVVGLSLIATLGYYGIPALLGAGGGVVAVARQSTKECVPSSDPRKNRFTTRPDVYYKEVESFNSCGEIFRSGLNCHKHTDIKSKSEMIRMLKNALHGTDILFSVEYCENAFHVNLLHSCTDSAERRRQIIERVCRTTAMQDEAKSNMGACESKAGSYDDGSNLHIYMGTIKKEGEEDMPWIRAPSCDQDDSKQKTDKFKGHMINGARYYEAFPNEQSVTFQ